MKKKYEKPMILVENFSLSTAIAGTCETKTNTLGYGVCGLDVSGVVIFLDTMGGCSFKVKDMGGDGTYNGLCYHVPADDNNLFNS